jgi:magnesium transporter
VITYHKSTENGLLKIDEPVNGTWISVIDPTTEEIEQISELGVPQDFITYPLDMDERPRTEKEDDGTQLIVLRVPFFQGITTDIPFITIPLGVILTEKYLITVCRRPNDVLVEFASGRLRGLSTGKRNRFLLRLLLNTSNKFLVYLREINKTVDGLEDRLTVSMRNNEVLELLKYQKSLVYLTTALRSNELLLERLQRSQMFKLYPDDEDLLDDVIIENQQAIEMTNITSNVLTSMMDAFASIISNNLNVVMKFLASITIVLSLPTIVTSFFGMNVDLPMTTLGHAYLIILGICLVLVGVVVYIFMKRDWF